MEMSPLGRLHFRVCGWRLVEPSFIGSQLTLLQFWRKLNVAKSRLGLRASLLVSITS